MYSFGSGVLFGVRGDIANATPINFGLLQDVSIDFNFNLKELYGQYQFPVALGRGMGKINLKASVARISAYAFGNLFFGLATSAGQTATAFAETGTIPGTPYQLTAANTATFVDDLGVVFAATGLPLTKVASGPTTGQYSVSAAGVYTFAAADTTLAVLISYTYTIASTGRSVPVTNQLLGTTPYFGCQFYSTFESLAWNIKFVKCVSSKLSLATKLEDFVIPNFEFSAFANAAGAIATISHAEAS